MEAVALEKRPGGAFECEDLPDPPGDLFIRPNNRGRSTRDDDLDLAALSERRNALEFRRDRMLILRQLLEGRKPLLLLRFDGAFLLRFAERTFAG